MIVVVNSRPMGFIRFTSIFLLLMLQEFASQYQYAHAFVVSSQIIPTWKCGLNIRNTRLHESAMPFSGSGKRQVDMNQYNLPIDVIQTQWTANYVAKTINGEGGVFLGCQNDREYFIDQIRVLIPRPSEGINLGIRLQEIAGGREDGLGIPVISGLVERGHVDNLRNEGVDIQPGDSISSISLVRNSRLSTSTARNDDDNVGTQIFGLKNEEEVIKVKTECLGYDATVDALLSLPAPISGGESLIFELKRLRRKPKVKVTLKYPPSQKESDATFELFAGENLRLGMFVRGATLNDPLAKRFDTKSGGNCGAGGLCRTCAVSVIRGGELLNPQKVAEKQMLADNPRWRLACKAFVGYGMKEGDITLKVNPNQW
jgi:hypothetical protein